MDMPNNFGWPGKIWILSDLHFNQETILKFERSAEFKSISKYNYRVIKNINSVVNKNDTLICLRRFRNKLGKLH